MKENPVVDTKEFELPETVYSRDIETRVIQVIILQCLSKLQDVAVIGGTLIDTLLGRSDSDRVKGIYVEQDSKNHQVKVKVEILVRYGISIPEKAEEVQTKIVEEITRLTGLHVATVHVVIKGLIPEVKEKKEKNDEVYPASLLSNEIEEDEVDAY
ncbi:MAG: Asp23/Gls24 family envelope stress response protein [Chlamydiales bacterium]|nr:Asp23/Gls24 family envelope stress response protein [Chlamydiales bacterium]